MSEGDQHQDPDQAKGAAPPASPREAEANRPEGREVEARVAAVAGRIGPPPDGEAIAELLTERHSTRAGDRVTVWSRATPRPALAVALESGRDRYEIELEYVEGAAGREIWMILADALDALFGTLVESGRAYRDLPAGEGVEFEGATFDVRVEHTIPELSRAADELLGER